MSPIAYRGAKHRVSPGTAAATPLCSHARRSPKKKKEKRPDACTSLGGRSSSISTVNCFSALSLFSNLFHHPLYITPSDILHLDVGTLLAGPRPGRNNSLSHTAILDIFNSQLNTHNMDVVTRIPELAKQFRVRLVFSEVHSCMF